MSVYNNERADVERVTVRRMDSVGIVVDDLEAATAFFVELDSTCRARGRSRAVGWTAWSGSRASGWGTRWWRPRTATDGSSW